MAEAKYVARKNFSDFKAGDPVPASKVGGDAERLLADGTIAEASSGMDAPPANLTAISSGAPDTGTQAASGATVPQQEAEPEQPARRLDETRKGGEYIVGGVRVNADGERI